MACVMREAGEIAGANYVSVSYVNQWQVFVNVVLAHTQETKCHSGFTDSTLLCVVRTFLDALC